MDNPFFKFSFWLGETTLAIIVTEHLNFAWGDFRVWTLWTISILAGLVQIIGRKNIAAVFKRLIPVKNENSKGQ